MTFDEYQQEAKKTAVYEHNFYPFGSLMIEAAEFADLVAKQQLRGDDKGVFADDLIAEAGDVLWNLAVALDQYEIDLSVVAEYNIQKLRDRQERGVLKGDGGNR
jgi:NTP pyrophosphatase (non-canonical NTP hydrolase)